MSNESIDDQTILETVSQSMRSASMKDGGVVCAITHLHQTSGLAKGFCLTCLEDLQRRGFVDFGVSVRKVWLTDKGQALLDQNLPSFDKHSKARDE